MMTVYWSLSSAPVNIQLVVDQFSDGLGVCSRARQSAVDFVMKRRELVHHSVRHRLPGGWRVEREFSRSAGKVLGRGVRVEFGGVGCLTL